MGNVAVPRTFSGHEGVREFWTSYRDTFGDMKSEFRNVFTDDESHAALEWNTSGDGVSLLEIQNGSAASAPTSTPRTVSEKVVG